MIERDIAIPNIFVMGLPRSGTTIYAKYLCSKRDLPFFQEAQWLPILLKGKDLSSAHIRKINQLWGHMMESDQYPGSFMQLDNMLKNKYKNRWLDHTPQNYKLLNNELLSDSEIFLIIRRPEDIYLSMRRTSWGKITPIRFEFQILKFLIYYCFTKSKLTIVKYEEFIDSENGNIYNPKENNFGDYGTNEHHKQTTRPISKSHKHTDHEKISLLYLMILRLLPSFNVYKRIFGYD